MKRSETPTRSVCVRLIIQSSLYGWQAYIHPIILIVVLSSMTFAQFKLPAYEKHTLQNGLTLYLMEQHEVPLIYVSAIFPAGAIWDKEQSGLDAFTADALQFGTSNYTKEEI